MSNIALFGGSFDPFHTGHLKSGKYICEVLGVDELWFLLSYNPTKDESRYASENHRLEMGRMMAKKYPDMPFVVSNIQSEIGTHITYDVLCELQKRLPEHNFIWVMGSDNLSPIKPDGSPNTSYFEEWENYDKIMEDFSIAVVDRPGYIESSRDSSVALKYKFLQASDPADLIARKNGWIFLDSPQIDMSASGLLEQLRRGERNLDPDFQDVEDYILEHGLYGVSAPESENNFEVEKS